MGTVVPKMDLLPRQEALIVFPEHFPSFFHRAKGIIKLPLVCALSFSLLESAAMSVKSQNSNPIPFFSRGDLYSLILWLGAVLITVCVAAFSLIVVWPLSILFDRKLSMMHRFTRLWAWLLIQSNPAWKVRVLGGEGLDHNKGYVIVANHQSIADIAAVLYALPLHFKFISKKEIFRIPLMGWHMRGAGYLSLDRNSAESGKRILLESRCWLKENVGMLLFPEGTRSLDGQIHAFKNGAFKLAHDQGVEILPVVIDGTGDCVPKGTWKISKPAVFTVSIEKPAGFSDLLDENMPGAVERIRQEMIARLSAIRAGKSL